MNCNHSKIISAGNTLVQKWSGIQLGYTGFWRMGGSRGKYWDPLIIYVKAFFGWESKDSFLLEEFIKPPTPWKQHYRGQGYTTACDTSSPFHVLAQVPSTSTSEPAPLPTHLGNSRYSPNPWPPAIHLGDLAPDFGIVQPCSLWQGEAWISMWKILSFTACKSDRGKGVVKDSLATT